MDHFAARADIVRLSDSDFAFLYGGGDHAGRAGAPLAAASSSPAVLKALGPGTGKQERSK